MVWYEGQFFCGVPWNGVFVPCEIRRGLNKRVDGGGSWRDMNTWGGTRYNKHWYYMNQWYHHQQRHPCLLLFCVPLYSLSLSLVVPVNPNAVPPAPESQPVPAALFDSRYNLQRTKPGKLCTTILSGASHQSPQQKAQYLRSTLQHDPEADKTA